MSNLEFEGFIPNKTMRALTLWQPWAHLVANGDKLVENRPWRPPEWIKGKWVAIHAGKKWDSDRLDFIAECHGRQLPEQSDVAFGAIIGVMKVSQCVNRVEAVAAYDRDQARWFMGPYAWLLSDTVALPRPIACRGRQRLWCLSEELEVQVREQLEEIHA